MRHDMHRRENRLKELKSMEKRNTEKREIKGEGEGESDKDEGEKRLR